MASTPPASPSPIPQRPASTIISKPPRSMSSRLSISTKGGIGSRASDEDGRTAVRVAVRIRPPLKASDPGFDLIPQRFQRSMVQTTSDTSLSIDSPQGRKLFVFDRVFGPDVQQDGIWDYLADSISSFTEGYNVSLLAYGQSGAGKSYTMGTSGQLEQQDDDEMGVVPRAATALFEKLDATYGPATATSLRGSISASSFKNPRGYGQRDALGDRNWSLKATYVEIYNEQLRDLLAGDNAGDRGSVAIREDTKGNILLTGLRQVDINSVDDLMNALNAGSTIRQTDSTAINAKSSRSHAVFSLNLVQRKSKLQTNGANKRYSMPVEALTGQEMSITTDSKLHFVDLAGSERLKNTGAQGERAKEGISINAGLASLGKVISQLSSRQSGSYVSYRDSKLTRLLQDSLGGNAITYMIACVTPPEFHLSETLNTVQYAQRARAIQSKPQIQQVEDSDKQAVIDRLKAEVSFLREQIRSAQNATSSPRPDGPGSERSQRQNERESELQNQLLDMQENYSALGNRHARLIAEMAKAGDGSKGESATQNGESGVNDATDRLNRSNSFAQAVEHVVLEYEKTIESLEHSLTSTRSTLSNTETSLLERETKCAYVETINGQLQSRVQKLMDRESNTENYLHDLEAKLDGHTSGDEKNATIMIELRKEIARIRENEASCEDYISTLEERLAEADQDQELMQREVDRLEQVVERQRSLGKLDSLLYELDNVDEIKQPQPEPESGIPVRRAADHSRNLSMVSRHSQVEDPIPEADEEALRPASRTSTIKEQPTEDLPEAEVDGTVTPVIHAKVNGHVPTDSVEIDSPAQSKHVADKLESVTGELVSLRVEHETTVTRYDALQLKYEEAVRKMSQLQDAVDEARHAASNPRDSVLSVTSHEAATRPHSFQSDQEANGTKDGARSSASRSLSSELSSAMESTDTADTEHELETEPATDISEDDAATTKPAVSSEDLHETTYKELSAEVERLKVLADEKESAAKDLADRYTKLESEHSETLDTVEELKTNLSKARAVEAVSPKASSHLIRRKSSQNLLMDRAHRSFASLRNIASDNFEGRPDVMQNFELNMNAAMHELHQRSERIQELEASVAATKKEMDTKMTIISGLTRERTSLKASPMDITMVATLRDKLEQHEKQLMDMKEEHTTREQKLRDELETLREASKSASPEPEAMERSIEQGKTIETHEKTLVDLRSELSGWEVKHQEILDSMRSADADSRQTVERLEGDLVSANKSLDEARLTASVSQKSIHDLEKKHQDLIGFLRSEIDEYKGMINSNTSKVADLEKEHANTKSELQAMTTSHATATEEASTHKNLVEELQTKIAAHEETTKAHQQALDELQTTHTKALSEAKELEQKGYEEQVEVLLTEHAETIRKLETEAEDAREDLMKVATQVATVLGVDVSIEKLTERIDSLAQDQKALVAEKESNKEMSSHVGELSTINDQVVEELESTKTALAELANVVPGATPALIADHVATIKDKVADLESRNEKSSRLVEELEEQLQHNFDEVQVTSKRLSNLQSERTAQLEEADAARAKLQADLDTVREEHSTLQAKLQEVEAASIPRSDSQSTIRKSASHNSLPSPPPAIPLPPLPMSPTGTRPMSRDNLNITQITEDQEARIRTIEKHLYAERQLTQTLEEALSDLEKQSKKVKSDCDAWKKRAQDLEGEVQELKDISPSQEAAAKEHRWSMLQVEEERKKRVAAEAARKQLEERMNAINKGKKKKGSLNCF